MKVLYVVNNAYVLGNGISTSARNSVRYLREAGVDVQLLSSDNSDPDGPQPMFRLKKLHFPVFQPIIDANGFCYAKRDSKVIREAVEWADVIHMEEPLFLERDTLKWAEKLGKPVVGTFHLYTQNILCEIPLASFGLSNRLLMRAWRNRYFDHYSHVQCPSRTVKRLLEKWEFKAHLHFIPNGIKIPQEPVVASVPPMKPYMILNIGRFATNKRQSTLLEAMNYSRHSDEILLCFAGKGPLLGKCQRMAAKLVARGVVKHPPVFGFHKDPKAIKALAEQSYLYVHCADVEVEGLGCLEAIREGVVPVISQGELVATSDFALDQRSVFPVGDAKSLAERIDWWIEHPQECIGMRQKYADSARQYAIRNSVDSLIEMYTAAIEGR